MKSTISILLICLASLLAIADHPLLDHALEIKPHDDFAHLPLRLSLEISQEIANGYQIAAASQSKRNPWHWELFTMPNTHELTVYMPGFSPKQVGFGRAIADGKFHTVVLMFETTRLRLFVDNVLTREYAIVSIPAAPPKVTEPFYFGKIDNLTCHGILRHAKLEHRVCDDGRVNWSADEATVGLWDFAAKPVKGYYQDSSSHGHHAKINNSEEELLAESQKKASLPLADTKDIRTQTATWLASHQLSADAFPKLTARDTVWDQWRFNLENHGTVDYAQNRRFNPKFRPDETQVYDRHSLVWQEDASPTHTILRRLQALLSNLRKAHPQKQSLWDSLETRCQQLQTAVQADTSFQPGSYYAACALRREALYANPEIAEVGDFLCVSRGVFEGSVRSIPLTNDGIGGHFATQYFGYNTIPGGGLYRVRNWHSETPVFENILENSIVENGRFKGQKLDFGAFCTPDVSFDGKRIAFAWTCNRYHQFNVFSRNTCWHIFTVNTDGTHLRMLTDEAYDDFDPCWLPNGRIAFVSERRGGYIRCFADYIKVRNHTLFSMKDDGTDIVPMSYFETSEWNPSINNDGMLVYARWDYTDRENCIGGRFWIANPDGTNPRAPHGNYPYPWHSFDDSARIDFQQRFPKLRYTGQGSRLGTPLVQMGIRAIPHSGKYVFIASPHHGQCYGSIGILDTAADDDGHHSQVKRFTPYEPYPETEISMRLHYKYGMPWPLSENTVIANCWEHIVAVDRFGNQELLCDLRDWQQEPDERFRLVDPIPLKARPCPPILPARTYQGERAQNGTAPKSTIAVMNVYDTDVPLPDGVKIKWLRVVQNVLKTNHAMGVPMIGNERENTPRIPLGIVPVEDDGSVYFEAPVAKELIFQLLDENKDAVHSMRSVAFAFPGEQVTCLGCHEPRQAAPKVTGMPQAMKRAPSRLESEMLSIEPISFERHIRPILERTCKDCGHDWFKQGKLDYNSLRDKTFWFSGGMSGNMVGSYCGIHGGSRTIPGRFGARVAPLAAELDNAAHQTKFTAAERHLIHLWLDCNSLRYGAFYDTGKQDQGELVWPDLDVDSDNPQGLERISPLKRNFWHENHYGPYKFLGSSHQRNDVYIMDEHGTIVWNYPIPHPQDVWMLDNGNVLIAWQHGAREVSMDKKTVWEYAVEAPNEVPSVQPLDNGNVLIGIVGQCRLVEADRQGREIRSIQLTTSVKQPHAQFRMCRKTPQGTYLVPFLAEGVLREINEQGTVIHEFPKLSSPVCAVRLPNGHTLVTGGGKVTEFGTDGKHIVWELRPQFELYDIDVAILAGVQRLPNGNTIVCNWNTTGRGGKKASHIFEATPDGRIVWECTSPLLGQVAQCFILGKDSRHISR